MDEGLYEQLLTRELEQRLADLTEVEIDLPEIPHAE